ncbi:PAS domain-containing sensor histidine kinase [Roseobacter sp. YSTF-M11]|uniref:histidine kinase n=1 Tax=Roseobacter insulae TaxID=2859783 RepID=A0A9X1K1X4_9RHOB|nr:PAS domain-containing sensor histidine kinase [Roseobacter insulae]MBW4707953.1 PAS domain-containing sensor histidine kinase [Roseobacter insulae]
MTDPFFACFDHVAAPVFVLEPDTANVPRYVGWNSFAETRSGLAREQVIGKTALEVYAGRMGQTAYDRHVHAIQTGQAATYEVELPIAGREIWVRTTLDTLCDTDGKVCRIVGTSIDISAEQEASKLKTSLVTAASEMEQFIAIAAHDLRTPMRNIQTLVEMLREDFEDHGDGKIDLIDLLDEVAIKSSRLISDVLTHAHDANVLPEQLPFDFGLMCQTVCDVLDPQALHEICWPDTVLQGDKTAFQIVLRNLLDNAIKHGGKPKLKIDISVHHAADSQISICVRDDGKGFANPGREFIDTGTFRPDSGYGLLGVRRLLTARGGAIEVEQNPHLIGGAVTFTLPGVIVAETDETADQSNIRPLKRRASR